MTTTRACPAEELGEVVLVSVVDGVWRIEHSPRTQDQPDLLGYLLRREHSLQVIRAVDPFDVFTVQTLQSAREAFVTIR